MLDFDKASLIITIRKKGLLPGEPKPINKLGEWKALTLQMKMSNLDPKLKFRFDYLGFCIE